MSPRDRRALLVLALWAAGVGAYVGIQKGIAFRKEGMVLAQALQQLETRKQMAQASLRELNQQRQARQLAFPPEWQKVGLDQLRVQGQERLLAGAQKGGIQGLRLREETTQVTTLGRMVTWTLEGEGGLPQWVAGMDGIEQAQAFMSVGAIRLDLTGDPWHPDGSRPEGPLLRGTVTCSWVVGP